MCKKNSPDRKGNQQTPLIQKEEKRRRKKDSPDKCEVSMRCVTKTLPIKEGNQHGMCKRKYPEKNKNKIKCQHGMCKRNSPDKNEASTGCVRETPQIKRKPAWDV